MLTHFTAVQAQTAPVSDVALLAVVLLAIGLIPLIGIGLMILRRSPSSFRSLLLISTDPAVLPIVNSVAKTMGCRLIHLYRYEDALSRLHSENLGAPPEAIIIDDSVPQSEAGLLLSALQRSAFPLPPLILVQDNVELEQTVRSYRADALVDRPLTARHLQDAIQSVVMKSGERHSV